MNDFTLEGVKDVVSSKSGNYRETVDGEAVPFEIKTCLNPEGLYFSYVRVAKKTLVTADFRLLEVAEQAAMGLCADMIAEACDGT